MLFYCYNKCSTCRKAQKWLDEHGLSYDKRDIKEENPSLAELEAFHRASRGRLTSRPSEASRAYCSASVISGSFLDRPRLR